MAGLAEREKLRVLILVMTYPHPSRKYTELVCTAGATEDRKWVRLYPIDYRYRNPSQRYHKYQWIEVEVSRPCEDPRPESRRPNLDTLRVCPEKLEGWDQKRAFVDGLPVYSVRQLQQAYKERRMSLGVVIPKRILDVEVRRAKQKDWKESWQQAQAQTSLFHGAPKKLEKLPFTFHYIFECHDDLKPRRAMVEDWEIGVLFLKERDRLGSETRAAESVREQLLRMVGKNREPRFFMGTRFPYNTWLILGVFWPPRIAGQQLGLDIAQ